MLDGSSVVLLTEGLLKIWISDKIVLGLSFSDSVAEQEGVSPLDVGLLVIVWVITICWSWVLLRDGPVAVMVLFMMVLVNLVVVWILDSISGGDCSLDTILEDGLLLGFPDISLMLLSMFLLVSYSLGILLFSLLSLLSQSSFSKESSFLKSSVSSFESQLSKIVLADVLTLILGHVIIVVEFFTLCDQFFSVSQTVEFLLLRSFHWLVNDISNSILFTSCALEEFPVNNSLEASFVCWHWLLDLLI